jgi:hypothetical protein
VLPTQDETIWTINRVAGVLSVPLLYVVMRRRFLDRIAADRRRHGPRGRR